MNKMKYWKHVYFSGNDDNVRQSEIFPIVHKIQRNVGTIKHGKV